MAQHSEQRPRDLYHGEYFSNNLQNIECKYLHNQACLGTKGTTVNRFVLKAFSLCAPTLQLYSQISKTLPTLSGPLRRGSFHSLPSAEAQREFS